MNIALVSPYDFAYPGGVTTHISRLAHQYARMGHRVKVLTPCSNKKALFDAPNVIPLGRTIPFSSNGSYARVTLSWWLTSKVKSILEEERFDIVHLHEPFCPLLPWIVLNLSDTTNVATFHAYYERSISYWLWRRWPLNGIYSKFNGRIAVSEPARRCINKYFPGDYRVIPHGIDLKHFSAGLPPIEEFCDGKLNILFVGRLEKRKGALYLLKAYEKVKKEFPQSRLIVVGPGNRLRQEYQGWVEERKLKDVTFTGNVSYFDLPRYYRTADIFCSPATGRESFGIVLLEAMAAGKPIIASNIEGYANVLSHGVEGLLVPPKDKEAIAQALLSLLSDQALRQQMGCKGREKAEEHSWERIAQRTLDYYSELLNGGGK